MRHYHQQEGELEVVRGQSLLLRIRLVFHRPCLACACRSRRRHNRGGGRAWHGGSRDLYIAQRTRSIVPMVGPASSDSRVGPPNRRLASNPPSRREYHCAGLVRSVQPNPKTKKQLVDHPRLTPHGYVYYYIELLLDVAFITIE